MNLRHWAVAPVLILIGAMALCTPCPPPSAAGPAPQVLRISINAEPTSLDIAKSNEADDGVLIKQPFEGPVRLDKDGAAVPGVAERWQVSSDGKVYTFTLRRNARWSNGDPVTAHDFAYSYIRALKPQAAASAATSLYYIANAEQYHTGKISDASQIGIRALDDNTLQIRLHTPAPFFLRVLANFAGLPVSRQVDQQNPTWMNGATTFVSNGPFRLAQWEPFSNVDIRKAFAFAVNRAALSEIVPGPVPLRGFIPFGVTSPTGEFRRQAGNLFNDNDVLTAREHLQRGLKTLGIRQLSPIVMRTWNRPVNVKIVQALQTQWKRTLGIQVAIESMGEAAFVSALEKGAFTLAQVSLYSEFDDASFLMLSLRSDSVLPPIGYRNPEVDSLLRAAEKETNLDKRTRLMIEAERIAIGQDMAVAPLLSGVRVFMQNPRLQDVYRYVFIGDDFRNAWFRP